MPLFRRKSLPPGRPPEDHSPYRDRYDIAREGYDLRIRLLARALDQSVLRNYISVLANIVLGVGMVVIAMRGGVRPVFIAHDQFGRIIQYDDLERFRDPPRALAEAEIARWLTQVRGIYRSDPVAQLDRGRAAKGYMTAEAQQWLERYFAEPDRNPAVLLQDRSRTVEVVSIAKDPDRPLWYLQWTETEISARGDRVESAWQGTIKVGFVPARTEDGVWANPVGLQISSIDWHRIQKRTGAPTPAAGATGQPGAMPQQSPSQAIATP